MENFKKKNGHRCCDSSWGGFLVKIFLAVVIILFVLCLTMFVATRITRKGSVGSGCLLGQQMIGNRAVVQQGGFLEKGNEWGKRDDKASAVRLFGTISKVEGNKITIKDNGALEQVVLSQAGTVILSAEGEVGLSVLKTGVNIVSLGTYDKDNQLVAKVINVVK